MTHFLSGITDEILQTKRDQLLETSREDLVSAAEKWLLKPQQEGKTSKVIFGAQSEEVEANLISHGWIYEDFNATSLKRVKFKGDEDIETW